MPRFYVDASLATDTIVELSDDVLRHVQVRRLREGDELTLFNGAGGEYTARLLSMGKRAARCRIETFDPVERESPVWLGLAQGISSGDKMDFTLQKGVEMGVSVFQPVASERSIVKLAGERAEKRVARWQEIVLSACEQCGRNRVPEVRPILGLAEWLEISGIETTRLILSPLGRARLADIAVAPQRAWLMAGPEGGFSDGEEAAALAAGWTPLRLGPRVLRSETAALAAVASIQTVWGDYSGQTTQRG
ncbi:16S rRNA (uracil(1498)-N(3))-methyltransferase [Paludibacterium yongneupense]|uniref:16S rRNA (uracil(1498)-N(3))-methyltransferase n=1 Tax=Paludibacterium yongneupense TaxID=400061 RepID=UPI00048DB70D|nr:16S rRNA (uracil(1498)-N(3))-methyltransferase [Paludibacterium yongneupense]